MGSSIGCSPVDRGGTIRAATDPRAPGLWPVVAAARAARRRGAHAMQGSDPDRSVGKILGAIAEDGATLVRKEGELARQELAEALHAWLAAIAAIAAAAVLAVVALVFVGLALEALLVMVMPEWGARCVIAAGALGIAVAAALIAKARVQQTTLPERTKQTVKENLEWAKAQLKR
jgi:hypothetical protein